MLDLLSIASLGTLVSLTALEVVLGIDNIIFLSILVAKVPRPQQALARRLGLVLALGTRIALLMTLNWLAGMTKPLFDFRGHGVSARDLVLMLGGGFLVLKSTWEIFSGLEGDDDDASDEEKMSRPGARVAFLFILVQIAVMDVVFSLDSVITAVGMANKLGVMIAAVIIALIFMLFFAGRISDFIHQHPSLKMLALSFLLLIGCALLAEGFHKEIPKGYIYFAMAFSVGVEALNIRMRTKKRQPVEMRQPYR